MKKIILATAITENYLLKAKPYFDSIKKYSNFDKNIVISLDFHLQDQNVESYFLSSNEITNKNNNNCIQHGEFLKSNIFNQFHDSDYVCFTDSDMLMQRPLTYEEVHKICLLENNDVFVQHNKGAEDNLYDEFLRLTPNIVLDKSFKKLSCYNTGIILCNKATWRRLNKLYNMIYPLFSHAANHYALQQWLLSYIINVFMNPIIMNYSFHTHHHYGRVPGDYINNNQLYINGHIVLFAHHIKNINTI
jgi:hypothetical protein